MEKPFYLIKRHPLKSFFIITFAGSWTIWFLAPMLSQHDGRYQSLIQLIGMYAPVLTAVLIVRIQEVESECNAEKHMTSKAIFLIMFFFFYLFSFVYFHYQLNICYEIKYMVLIGFFAMINAYIISSIFSENKGIANLLSPLTLWKVKVRWYVTALLLPPMLWISGVCVDLLFGGQIRVFIIQGSLIANLRNFCISFFTTFFFGGPLNEEAGWRGFALPKLQQKHSTLTASVILGVIWSSWHIPLHLTGFYDGGIQSLLVRYFWNIPLAVIFSWIYNEADQSLLIIMLLHTSVNTTSYIVNFSPRAKIYSIAFLIICTFVIVLRNKLYVPALREANL